MGRVREELRDDLDKLAEYLKTFRPDDWKENQRFWNNAEAAEAQAEYAIEIREAQEVENARVIKEEEQEEESAVTTDREKEEDDSASRGKEEEDSAGVKREVDG